MSMKLKLKEDEVMLQFDERVVRVSCTCYKQNNKTTMIKR